MSSFPDEIVEAVAIGNFKSISEQPAMFSNLLFSNVVATTNLSSQNAVANQQSMNELNVTVTAKSTNAVSDLGPLEARSAVDILSNNEIAQTIADLKASVQAFSGGSPSGNKPITGNHQVEPTAVLSVDPKYDVTVTDPGDGEDIKIKVEN